MSDSVFEQEFFYHVMTFTNFFCWELTQEKKSTLHDRPDAQNWVKIRD